MLLAAPQGFEPRYAAPEAAVLPLNEGATSAKQAILQPCLTRPDTESGSGCQPFHHTDNLFGGQTRPLDAGLEEPGMRTQYARRYVRTASSTSVCRR